MIFDALRQIAGAWLSDIKPLVDEAILLHLPVTPHQVLPREQDLETMSHISVNFHLPHPIVAIEDNASCILLIDHKPNLVGLHEQRSFIECVPLNNDEGHYNDTLLDRALCEAFKGTAAPGVYAVCAGNISSPAQRAGSWLAVGDLQWIFTGTVTEQHTTIADFQALPGSIVAAMTQAAMRNAMTAIEEIIALDRGTIGNRR